MNTEIIEKLYDSFELREREGMGGMKFKYIPAHDVIDRMNKVFEGRWMTEVTSQERVDDFVVVRVRVSVFDDSSKTWFAHDGYGSSSVARYSGGQKAGQIIDLGNSYKSAEAKAIKNACTRWGVGLFLEAEDEEQGPYGDLPAGRPGNPPSRPTTPPSTPSNNNAKPSPTAVTPPSSPSMPPPFPSSDGEAPKPKGSTPSVPEMPSAPSNNAPEPKKSEPTAPPTPPSTNGNGGVTQENDHKKITDVQTVAIQGLLRLRASSFGDLPPEEHFGKLVADALGRKENLPSKIEELSYQDAVTVIKYGNELDKK
jgi:hypothetical protein